MTGYEEAAEQVVDLTIRQMNATGEKSWTALDAVAYRELFLVNQSSLAGVARDILNDESDTPVGNVRNYVLDRVGY